MQTQTERKLPAGIIAAQVISFRDPQTAFDAAIACNRLSTHPQDFNYAGRFMYMGTFNGRDTFKNLVTREYLA